MICPHLRFAAYLIARKLPLDKFIQDLPIPDITDISAKFPNANMGVKWLEKAGVLTLRQKNPDAKIAYMLWQNAETRVFIMASILKKENPLEILENHYCITVSDYAFQLFKSIFMDISDADLISVKEYAKNIAGLDHEIINLCLSKKTWVYIQDKLDIHPREINHDTILAEMFVLAYKKYIDDKDLPSGKFALAIQKELRDVKNNAHKNVLKNIEQKLKSFDTQQTYITLEELRESSLLVETPSLLTDPS